MISALQHSSTPTVQHSNSPALQQSSTPTVQHSNSPSLQQSSTPTVQHFNNAAVQQCSSRALIQSLLYLAVHVIHCMITFYNYTQTISVAFNTSSVNVPLNLTLIMSPSCYPNIPRPTLETNLQCTGRDDCSVHFQRNIAVLQPDARHVNATWLLTTRLTNLENLKDIQTISMYIFLLLNRNFLML